MSATFGYSDTRRIVLLSLHARYKPEVQRLFYAEATRLNFIIPLDIVCQVYSCTKPCTLRPLLAGPVIGVNLLASSASKTLTCSNSSGLKEVT